MNFVYVDCISGASGDMLLASFIDMGFPVQYCIDRLATLQLEKVTIDIEKVDRNGIRCTFIHPKWEPSHEYRHFSDIMNILRSGSLEENIIQRSEKVLTMLASAEAEVHGIALEKVHFHEIGALDTIVDIVGFCCTLEYFKIDKVFFSSFTDGYGTIKAAHGTMPVPVPAVSKIIRGYRFKSLPVESELLTPTGAALLAALGTQVESVPEGVVLQTGYGCGSRIFKHHPNYLRLMMFSDNNSTDNENDQITVIESDMDHISGEIMGSTAALLFENGALDVVWIPVFMKKGRPGYRISIISPNERSQILVDLLIKNTRTLGVRVQQKNRYIASRESRDIQFLGETCAEKRCSYKGYTFSKLELTSLETLSKLRKISIIDCMEEYIRQNKNNT